MDLRVTLLAALRYEHLQRAVRDLRLEGWQQVGLRSRTRLRRTLTDAVTATPARLVHYLEDEELSALCLSLGVPGGRRREHLIEDLLQAAEQPQLAADKPARFVAIDFETADYQRDSACALALVRVEGDAIVERQYHLIRPPRREFVFSYLHGITWAHVQGEPAFRELWPRILPILQDIDFVAAHNAPFDRSVLHTCCADAGYRAPTLPFLCTVRLARQAWNLFPTKLPDVCSFLGLDLQHHHAASDAEACARIVMAARPKGKALGSASLKPRSPRAPVTTRRSGC